MTAALAALVDAAVRQVLPAGSLCAAPGGPPAGEAARGRGLADGADRADGRFDAEPGELGALAAELARVWSEVGTRHRPDLARPG